jgi:hypothetical protein
MHLRTFALGVALLLSAAAHADDDPWKGTDLYNRTLVPPDNPQLRGNRRLYPWQDGSLHTITEPPPRTTYQPAPSATNRPVRERSAPGNGQDDTAWQAELAQHRDDPRFCATHTRTASAMDRCVRAQHGEKQIEDYDYVPGNDVPGTDHSRQPDCPPGYWLGVSGCQKR